MEIMAVGEKKIDINESKDNNVDDFKIDPLLKKIDPLKKSDPVELHKRLLSL